MSARIERICLGRLPLARMLELIQKLEGSLASKGWLFLYGAPNQVAFQTAVPHIPESNVLGEPAMQQIRRAFFISQTFFTK